MFFLKKNYDSTRGYGWETTADDKKNIENEKKASTARNRLEAFRFSLVDIPVGSIVEFKDDRSKTAEVIGDRKVRYEGNEYSLSALAMLLTGKETALQGPMYFMYEGELLTDRRKRLMEE